MTTRLINNVKLGAFVIVGLIFLVILLYMIGKNRNLFGSTYTLKARFENVQGLVPGNNVRFSGIQAGTVKRIKILNDTVIEVTMYIDAKMKTIIRKNAIVSIGTDGLVGNKVANIIPNQPPGALAVDGDILNSKIAVNTDEMLETLYQTNKDVAFIAAGLKTTVQNINSSNALWEFLKDQSLPKDLKISAANIRTATAKASNMVEDLHTFISDVKSGKGSLGALLTDSSFAWNLNEAILKIKSVGDEADKLLGEFNTVVSDLHQDIKNGKGTVNALLRDSLMLIKINSSLDNIQKGTDGFNQNMEALKNNIFFRSYFRKLEKQKMKEENN